MMFLFIIMGSTHGKAPAGFAPLAIGLGLTLIHLVSIPVTNTSVNPARSTGPALFVGGWALAQLWLFWVAPLVGGALGGDHLSLAERGTVRAGDRRAVGETTAIAMLPDGARRGGSRKAVVDRLAQSTVRDRRRRRWRMASRAIELGEEGEKIRRGFDEIARSG